MLLLVRIRSVVKQGNRSRSLEEARKLVGWSAPAGRYPLAVEELTNKARVGESYLGRLERGQENVGVVTLSRLARALKVELAEFFVAPGPGDKAPKPLPPGRRATRISDRRSTAKKGAK